jgi:pimeloyl-ACP methyl ester carboxylesterase
MPMFELKDGTNCQIHFEKKDGILKETTLFIHGNLASNRWWYPAEQKWIAKAKFAGAGALKGSMILAEFRGCGESSAPGSQAEVDMHRFANDFIALVRSFNFGKINLVGHSTGGLIAALMLAKAPELFDKAFLLDPVGAQGIKFQNGMEEAFAAMKTDKALLSAVMASTIYNCEQTSDFFRQIVVEDAFKAVNSVGSMVLKALDGFDARTELAMVQHPVLVCHGEHDTLLPMDASKELANLFKNGKFQVIPGHGHCTNAEDAGLFTDKVDQFLFS